jgi:hypothetical protein
MKELITLLQEIDNDYYKGVYTAGEMYDLIKGVRDTLKVQKFI